jgi:hypothetical protein
VRLIVNSSDERAEFIPAGNYLYECFLAAAKTTTSDEKTGLLQRPARKFAPQFVVFRHGMDLVGT